MDQSWERVVFLHWKIPSIAVAPLLPRDRVPDEFEGSSWVALIGFEMVGAGFGYRRPVPYFGTFAEINVRLYSIDGEGRRGVVFRSLEASRLAVVLGTNLARVPYRWASMTIDDDRSTIRYRSRRLAPPHRGASTDFFVVRGSRDMSDEPLAQFLTARWGLHTSVAGRLFCPEPAQPLETPRRPAGLFLRSAGRGCRSTEHRRQITGLGAVLGSGRNTVRTALCGACFRLMDRWRIPDDSGRPLIASMV